MNTTLIKLHKTAFIYLFLSVFFVVTITFSLGELKAIDRIDWLDVIGEGCMNLFFLIWILLTTMSRLTGRVTRLLLTGLITMHISMLLDFIDEFLDYSDSSFIAEIESLPAPIGMLIMTVGIYYWHQEQLSVNQQLRKQERFHREHRYTDAITGLYGAIYMKQQIDLEIEKLKDSHKSFSLIMVDIKKFDKFNRKFGDSNGNQFLKDIAQLITLNIREVDLVCRLASDRFIVLLPQKKSDYAEQVAKHIQQSIATLAYKPNGSDEITYHQVSTSVTSVYPQDSSEGLLNRLNQQLNQMKSISVFS